MKKVFVAIFSILLIAILLSTSKVNAKVDVNIREEVILEKNENEKVDVIFVEEEKETEENKPCVQSLNVSGSTRRSNGHQEQWFDMGEYTISGKGSVDSSCFQINKSSSIVNVQLVGTKFSFSPQSHGNASVTISVSPSCTCSGETISRTAGFTFSEWGLLDLSIAGYDLSPAFNNMKTEYTATVPNEVTSIKINGKSVDGGSEITISINDTKVGDKYIGKFETTIDNLKIGENEIKINVVTPEKVSRDTIIMVTRDASDESTNNDVLENSIQPCTVEMAEQMAKILYREIGFGNFAINDEEYFFAELATASVILNNVNTMSGDNWYDKILNLPDEKYNDYSVYKDVPFAKSVSNKRRGELLYISELVLTGKFNLPSNILGQSSCACLLGTKSCVGVDEALANVNECKNETGWGEYWTHIESKSDTLFDVYFGYSKDETLSNIDVFGNPAKSLDDYKNLAKELRLSDYSSYTSKNVCNGLTNISDISNNGNYNKTSISSFFLIKDSCFNPDILRIVRFILVLIDIVRFVVPMALIVYGAIDFSKAAIAGEEKTQKEKINLFVKRLINAVALFLIPVIVEFLIVFLGDLANDSNFTDCIQNANKEKIAELQEELDKKREEIANENEETNLEEKNDYDYITYIGDSRTVGMCGAVQLSDKENCTIAESGMGYSWLTSYDIKNKLDKVLTEHQNSYVIINMGTNSGLSSNEGKEYAIYYNELSKKYPTSKIVAISVTQVVLEDARKHGMYTHERYNNPEAYSVKKFNEGLKSNLDSNVKYCDVYSALDKRGYDTKDGVHYTPETYKVIYEEIQKCLK